jgi:hypothetical protein
LRALCNRDAICKLTNSADELEILISPHLTTELDIIWAKVIVGQIMFYSSLSGMGLASVKGQAAYDVDEARADASEAKSAADVLKHDVDRLMMITEALWSFLKKEHGYSDEELVKAVGAIDLRHSGADKDAQEKCPSCGRLVSAHRRLCIYCGNQVPQSLFEP